MAVVTTDMIVTAVSAVVPRERETEFLDGYRAINASKEPDGLLRSQLLRGSEGDYVIQTVWRDRDALMAARDPNTPPAGLALLDRVDATHSHEVLAIEQEHEG